MNKERWHVLFDNNQRSRREIMLGKNKEYTMGMQDAQANFYKAAHDLDISPFKVWQIYFHKHLCAIMDYIRDPNGSRAEPIRGRVLDALNYLDILTALISDFEDGRIEFDEYRLKKKVITRKSTNSIPSHGRGVRSFRSGDIHITAVRDKRHRYRMGHKHRPRVLGEHQGKEFDF